MQRRRKHSLKKYSWPRLALEVATMGQREQPFCGETAKGLKQELETRNCS
jgi:hypothetical protein